MIVLGFSLLAAACAGSESPAPASPAQPAPAAAAASADGANPGDGPAYGTCEATFARQRDCQDVFLPALVDLRVRLDVPPGIAEADATEGRDALLAVAEEEFASDSTDESIAATCDQMRASAPAALLAQAEQDSDRCLQADACEPFVECILPVIETGLTAPR